MHSEPNKCEDLPNENLLFVQNETVASLKACVCFHPLPFSSQGNELSVNLFGNKNVVFYELIFN